jgi:hypothetical protein
MVGWTWEKSGVLLLGRGSSMRSVMKTSGREWNRDDSTTYRKVTFSP